MNNVEEYFRESEGEGIDDDNFTNTGSGIGFYQGDDFVASIPEFEQPEYEQPEIDIPELDIPEYEQPEFDIPEYAEIDIPEIDIPEIDIPEYAEIDVSGLFSTPPLDLTEGFGLEDLNQDSFGLGGLNNSNSTNTLNFLPFNYNDINEPDYLVFDTEYYSAQNPEISSSSDPFEHFVNVGAAAGKEYRYTIEIDYIDYTPAAQETALNNEGIAQKYAYALSGDLSNLESFLTSSGFLAFDTDYYLLQNPDVTAAGVDPILHFSQSGLTENRDHRYTFPDTNQAQDWRFPNRSNTIFDLQFGTDEGRISNVDFELGIAQNRESNETLSMDSFNDLFI